MAKNILPFLVAMLLLAGASSLAQQPQATQGTLRPTLGKAIGKLTVDGTSSQTTTTIFVQDEVATDASTHLHVINAGNSLVFTPNSNFQALKNGYRLKSGGSKVATYTGLTAHLPDCFSVTPVNPVYMTLYEVNWSGSAAYVYARSEDVKINYWMGGEPKPDDRNPRNPDRDWIVKEGHTARINDVHLCRPLLDFWPQPNLPTALELAGTAAVVTSEPFWPIGGGTTKQNMSAEGP